jgi:subtilase family serine protease
MLRRLGTASFALAALAALLAAAPARAQFARELPPRIGIGIGQQGAEGNMVALTGNVRPEARPEYDRGAVVDYFPMEHMLLQLRRPAQRERALEQFIGELHTKGSANFHKWTNARKFGERFGPPTRELEAVTRWLEMQGFKVNVIYPSRMVIDFSGTAGQVRRAFGTEIHHLDVKGEKHIANMSDPRIPAALASSVAGIVSLHDFRPTPMHQMRKARSQFNDSLGGLGVVPEDLATIYNLNPVFGAGISGQGQTIVVIEDSDVFSTSDWDTFRSTFGLSGYTAGSFTTVFPPPPTGPNNCSDPGVIPPIDAEAILDAEWASAAAPSAAIQMAVCADSGATFGGLIALQNLINASPFPPAIMSISYGQCEPTNGEAANAAYNSAYQQAVAEGVSVFVAAGDSGPAGCDNSSSGPATGATHGIAVNAFASTPYNVAVGGTDFSDTYSGTSGTYWNSTNSANFGSALSYIPEIPWNDSCASVLLTTYWGDSVPYGPSGFCNDTANLGTIVFVDTVGGGGGPSGCATGTPAVSGVVGGTCAGWAKPAWQSIFGNPSDGVRDTPDVSLFAADGAWNHYYVFCWSDPAGGAPCTSAPDPPTLSWSGAGGTSFASPIMAGFQALINQNTGSRQGNPNPTYYILAAGEYGTAGNSSCNSSNGNTVASTCIFYDVTLGDNDMNCLYMDATDLFNCYDPPNIFANGYVGVLSTDNNSYQPAFTATTGWDFATGIGTVNVANLVNNWPMAPSSLSGMWDVRVANPLNPPTGQIGETEFTLDMDIQGSTATTESLSDSGLANDAYTNSACSAAGSSFNATMNANFLTPAMATFQIFVDGGESYTMTGALSPDGTTVTGSSVTYNSSGANCGANDAGSAFTATLFKPATGTYMGSFTPDAAGAPFSATITLNEDGNFNLTGTLTATGNSCFSNLSINSSFAPSFASGDVMEFFGTDSLGNQVGFVGNAGGSLGAAGDTSWAMLYVTATVYGGACSGQTFTDAPFHKLSRTTPRRGRPIITRRFTLAQETRDR